jgi:uncharacterized protein
MSTIAPFGHPFYVMAKPVGSSCNLSCSYCYYLSKEKGRMSDALLEEFIRQNTEAQTQPEILFTWHGGEPLLLPIIYYARALELQQKYAHGRHIDNCLQTNGTLLNDEWCQFFREHNFLIGISIDGPEPMHNTFRQDFEHTLRGIRLLQKHGVEWNAMATVNSRNADTPIEFYHFFKDLGCKYLQFTPVVERTNPQQGLESVAQDSKEWTKNASITTESVEPLQWGRFLTGLYDEWIKEDVGNIFIQLFDATLANWVGQPPGLCSMSALCGLSPALQPDGSLYSCDHFVFPSYKLGNIHHQTIAEMMYGNQQQRFMRAKRDSLSQRCRECAYLFACHGECPRNRFLSGNENYLCEGYRMFFRHVSPTMNFMAQELAAGRAPSNVMRMSR